MHNFTLDPALCLVLRSARRDAGLTQKEAAAIAGCDPSWWKKTEAGRAPRVGTDTFARMARAARVSPEELDVLGHQDIAGVVRMLQVRDGVCPACHGTGRKASRRQKARAGRNRPAA